MYFSTPKLTAICIAFTSLICSVHSNCIERPMFLKSISFGLIDRWCKPGQKPDPPFDFKKWASTHTFSRPTGTVGYARPTGARIFWQNNFMPTGIAGKHRVLPTGGVFWHQPGQAGTAASRIPRPTFTFTHHSKSTSTASATTTSRAPTQTPQPRAVEWTG